MRHLLSEFLLFSLSAMGGQLRVAVPNAIYNTDPLHAQIVQEEFIVPFLYQSLFKLDSRGNLQPDLANQVTVVTSNKVRISIRRGQVFSNGEPVTADDVVNSAIRLCSSKDNFPRRLRTLDGCSAEPDGFRFAQVRKVNNDTIEFQIHSHPNAFLHELASPTLYVFKEKNSHLIGSGPYELAGQTPREVRIRRRHPKDGENEEIDFQYIPEKELLDHLRLAEVDIATMYLTPTSEVFNVPSFTRSFSAPYVSQTLVLNPHRRVFSDQGFRQALYRKFVSDAHLEKCRAGLVASDGLIPEGIGGHDAYLPADKRWQDYRLQKRQVITIHQAKDRSNDCERLAIQRVFNQFNIDARFQYDRNYPNLVEAYGTSKLDAYVELFAFLSRDASGFFYHFTTDAPRPFLYYTSKEVDALLEIAAYKPSVAERFQVYRRLNDMIVDQANSIPLYSVGHSNIFQRCLKSEILEGLGTSNANSFLPLAQVSWTANCDHGKKP